MPDPNLFYQAPQEVNSYVNPGTNPVPAEPNDLYSLLGISGVVKQSNQQVQNPYEKMMSGGDVFKGGIPDASPLQTNLNTLKPLDDSAGLFHSQDGFGKYGYSTLLGNGDNEDRYASNFRRDNPGKFFDAPGIHPLNALEKGIYWGGGFVEKTLESAVVKLGQGLSGLYGMTIGNGIGAIQGQRYNDFADWLGKSSDNVFSNLVNGWDQNLRDRYHYFQEKADRSRKGFVSALGDGDFWMNDLSDGLSFMASAAFEVGAISKLGLGTKAANLLSPLAEGVSTEALEAGTATGTNFLTKAANFVGLEGTGNKLIRNAVDLTSQTLATTAIESGVEANQVRDDVYKSFEGKVNPDTGMPYTDDDKNRAASEAAAADFKQNMAILIGPKFLETLVFHKIGGGIKSFMTGKVAEEELEGGASSALKSRLGNLAGGTSVDKLSALKTVMKIGSVASAGFLSEGLFEENIQQAIQTQAEQDFGASDEFYRPSLKQKNLDDLYNQDRLFGNVGSRYINQTKQFFKGITDDRFIDDQLSKSIGLGGLFGVAGGAIFEGIGIRQQAKVDRYWSNILNSTTKNIFESDHFYKTTVENRPDPKDPTKTIPTSVLVTDPKTGNPVYDENKIKNTLNQFGNIQGLMNIISQTEDPSDENNKAEQNIELNKLARNVLFSQLATAYIRAGKKNLLLSNLKSISNFSDKDIKSLGYEPGNMSNEDESQMLERMSNMVERLDKAHEWIENNVINNSTEKKEGFGGLKYSKTQMAKMEENFLAKKEYLYNLARQNSLMDNYLDEISHNETKLGSPSSQVDNISSIIGPDGNLVIESNVGFNQINRNEPRIEALRNQIDVLRKEFSFHWDNIETIRRDAPKSTNFSPFSKTNNGLNLAYHQVKVDDTLQKIDQLVKERNKLSKETSDFLKNNQDNYTMDEDNNLRVKSNPIANSSNQNLQDINDEKIRKVNEVKREEINIQKDWINKEWKDTAALKENKTRQGRKDTIFSPRMLLNKNTQNQYFEREAQNRDNSQGISKLNLVKDKIDTKKYKANENKLLDSVRIKGKVLSILADANGQKLLTELDALVGKELPREKFTPELKKIIDSYNGKPIILKASEKSVVDDQLDNTRDELDFANNLLEYYPEDDRFNDKYYDKDQDGNFVVKPEYDDPRSMAPVILELGQRIKDLSSIKDYLEAISTELEGDWSNENSIKKIIANNYTEPADNIILNYNKLSNNGESEISGDSLSTKQDLDNIDHETAELKQLKTIFEDRNKSDVILASPEFKNFIENIDKRLETLGNIRAIVKERLSSRLAENRNFLIDSVNSTSSQLGIDNEGNITNQTIHDIIENIVSKDTLDKVKTTLSEINDLIKQDQTNDTKKAIETKYWTLNGQIISIKELVKANKDNIISSIDNQNKELLSRLEDTNLMKLLKEKSFYGDIINNINDSVLGILQTVFYSNTFTQVASPGFGREDNFIDDKPNSLVYKFREDYNLSKFIRNVQNDNSRTTENSEVSKDDLLSFLVQVQKMQQLQDLKNDLNSTINLPNEVEREKEVVQAKIDNKDNRYSNLIIPSIQQLFFIRNIASFLRRGTVEGDKVGFRNWIFIQAPGGAGKTQTLGTWFNTISGITRDRILATAFTEQAARGIKRALLVGEDGPKDIDEMIDKLNDDIKNNKYDHDVLIVDEFPAIDVDTQKKLFNAVSEYTKNKLARNQGEFKVITMGDTNQLTFTGNGSIIPISSILVNPNYFNKKGENDNNISKMNIIPSLTINFRSNLFPITSFIDQFKGSNENLINKDLKVYSTNPDLTNGNVKGVVSLNQGQFKTQLVNYINSAVSPKTRTLIVNEAKIPEYTKLLENNGIKIITDPNDELTKGIYLTPVKNVQGFSFDEVFIDMESNDKKLFLASPSPNYVFNKAMYVAASRARDLIVITNFPNFENIQDPTISNLENKALEELQTKDKEFIGNRDTEIDATRNILGNNYNQIVTPATVIKSTDKSESPEDIVENEPEIDHEDDIQDADIKEIPTNIEDEVIEEDKSEGEIPAPTRTKVETTDGVEDNIEELDQSSNNTNNKTLQEIVNEISDKIRDKSITGFTKIKDGIVNLLFPTSSTIKYKLSDGVFTSKPNESEYENRNLRDGDKVILVPFKPNKTSNNPRKFGYAIVTPAINSDNSTISNSYRTIAILSNKEIDELKENAKTKDVYDTINENEKRDLGFINIDYGNISDNNGFTTSSAKSISNLYEGSVIYSNPIIYSQGSTYTNFNKKELDNTITKFINNFYKNRQDSMAKIKIFYNNPDNIRVVIPTSEDLTKNRLRIPEDFNLKVGRPYLVFEPFDKRSTQQFIPLSRRFLDNSDHNDTLQPIKEFITLGKVVRSNLENKGITSKLGYSKSLANMLSKLANQYSKEPDETTYKVKLFQDKRSTEYTFSPIEAERIFNLYNMFSIISNKQTEVKTAQELENLSKLRRARNLTFDDGDTIYGTIEPLTEENRLNKTFNVKDIRTGETIEKSGTVRYSDKSYTGPAQETLDNIFNSNSNISSKFISNKDKSGFVTRTDKERQGGYSYNFMSLLGSKVSPVIKNYDTGEKYDDVIDILENLFNTKSKGELPGVNHQYLSEDGKVDNIDIKFRVPVPLNSKNEQGQLEHDYTYSSQNTSRANPITNSKYFESNFEDLLPSQVYTTFAKSAPEEIKGQTLTDIPERTPVKGTIEIGETIKIKKLTPEEVTQLSFPEIQNLLDDKQKENLTKALNKDGWDGIEDFFSTAESNHPEEQGYFRDYIINCLI